ncbi:2-oxoglutarate-Fe(II) type oxidoreductase hxnY-like isoform X2 [Phragmites australis]|uniref:2-oxoglutarate-Fe(II) type oxidoreductase hxnY-like isoform X2 n=1 Tax=Phragmites australis TaxID=29695 RepID=UPI002D7A346B|nr:2-oxoglutarate-Fe(II) type oxidoreductase hxnY-like isoform X2 [Phragmites australis]
MDSSTSRTSLNCISLADPDIQKSVALLKQACLDSGFFYVVDHGISQEFMDEVFDQSKKFFDLPHSDKMTLLRDEKNRGLVALQVLSSSAVLEPCSWDENLDRLSCCCGWSNFKRAGDYKEGYYIGVEVPVDDPQANRPFYGPNQWPSEEVLPKWREVMEQYHSEALRVAKSVSRIIALALNLDVDFFDRPEMLGEPIATLRLLHYEGGQKTGQVSNPAKGVYGAGAHSDYGLITLLATDDVVGLQICKDRNAQPQVWEYVAPVKGGFIVNLGDMLERWSNCIFRSTLHRVVLDGRERYSIAYFVEPSHDCVVECLPTCKSETNPPKFPPITCSAYLSQRYKDTHADLSSYSNNKA